MSCCDHDPNTLKSYEEAVQLLLNAARPLDDHESISLTEALGRVLAIPVLSVIDVPPWDYSAMDGYAVRSADVTASGVLLPISQRVPAGTAPDPLLPGTAARIFTGGPIPTGADSVVIQVVCEPVNDSVRILETPKTGANIRRTGEDIRKGSEIIGAGTLLRPQHLGLAASVGIAELVVTRRPRVALFSTGDELLMPGQPLAPGNIYNSNLFTATGLLEALGCEVVPLGIVEDSLEATCTALEQGAREADLVLASGGVSIAALFIAGYLPGILLALSLMAVCGIWAKRKGYPVGERTSLGDSLRIALDAIPSLFLIVLIIGGIVGGIFTPTEASAIAVLYALILSVFIYREVSLKQLPDILVKSAITTAIVMFLIGTSSAMSWILSYENIPQSISAGLLELSSNPIVILLTINLILLAVGIFMDMTPAVLIFTPIFLPVASELGMSPLHFGIMMVLNLCIGLCTPPVGSVLFVGASIAKTSITQLIRPLLPMYLAMFIVLMLVAYVPALSEALPRLFGLY